jgi:hypothetical protein
MAEIRVRNCNRMVRCPRQLQTCRFRRVPGVGKGRVAEQMAMECTPEQSRDCHSYRY